ncbi:MAG: sigma 54-interacting transcriptional regulator [Candidatus Hydrogenedentes bacterium]|nr:sigma 54-interacting transcriptional regulator [Candidatus Hydrogenedentota bacterium]
MPQTTSIPMELIATPMHEALLGVSEGIREANALLQRLAQSDITVLITGESGTGKDIAARLLHKPSPRKNKPFIKVNCPAIPESILESELFGYERGAFTGARTSKPGRFELANHGTIFLDEIAETSQIVQGKLLQILDGDPFVRIGGVEPISVDVRIIAATNINLAEAVAKGQLREDIYFRLSEVVVELPSLRQRPEDLPILVEHFNYNYRKKFGKEYQPLEPGVIEQLQEMDWPGNVRELAARVKQYVATNDEHMLFEGDNDLHLSQLSALSPPDLDEQRESRTVQGPPKIMPLKEATKKAVETTERALIEEALRITLWNRRKAAKLLKISYSSLLRRIDAYNIGKTKLNDE